MIVLEPGDSSLAEWAWARSGPNYSDKQIKRGEKRDGVLHVSKSLEAKMQCICFVVEPAGQIYWAFV